MKQKKKNNFETQKIQNKLYSTKKKKEKKTFNFFINYCLC